MSFINGLLGLGTAVVSGVIAEPASGTGYVRAPIAFDVISGAVTLNVVNGVFGPFTAAPGTLSVFQLFDPSGNPAWTGTLQAPITPSVGQQVYVPVGAISVPVDNQLNAGSAASGLQSAITVPAGAVLGNATSGASPVGMALYAVSGIGMASGSTAGSGALYVTPATSGAIGGVVVPVGGYLSVDVSGNLSLGTSGFTDLLNLAAQQLPKTAPGVTGVVWNNNGALSVS